ncbi:MAG: aminotransferase class I/II-fold pyridoxal phosphate-dependent enzyme [Bacteroidales bacterium]|nr:aminotransferase class I/II-fold pyridoxal phosphate-dependent enzyme [Bacteroidales bacterium]
MQAVILAAGMGRRLGDLTKDNTKCMVKVNGVALIDRLLGQLSALELNRVVIVVGYEGDKLIAHIGDRYAGRLNIEYIVNPIYDRTNNIYSLALTKDKLQEDDTLLIESDLIFDDKMFSLILGNPYPNLALVAKYQTWMDGTMVRIDEDNNVVNFITKSAFKYSDVDYYYKTVNIYKFSREFLVQKYIPFLDAYCAALGNNEYYEQVLRVICMLDNSELKALPISGEKWYEIDDVQDLDIAEALFASDEEHQKLYMKRFGGYWRFPGMLDYCYLVNPYFPSPRLKDELRANFDTLLTEYPSGMYVNSLLAGKCFGVRQDYVVPGNGAAELIKSLMGRLEGKLGVIYPTFEEYPNRRVKDTLEIFVPQTEDFHYTADDVIGYFSEHRPDSLLLINPDNPSGNYIPYKDVLRLAEWCKNEGVRLVVDESFVDFSSEFPHNTLLRNDLLERFPDMIVVKSISKSFGVPGLRLGIMASADTELIAFVKKDVSIWNLNSFAEFFMQIYTKHEGDYRKAAEKFGNERGRFYEDLSSIPYLKVYPSEANYFLCEVMPPYNSHNLAVTLLKNHNILIKDCSGKKAFAGRNCIRLAVRNRQDNERLVSALKQVLI